jgi:hypothetical protein
MSALPDPKTRARRSPPTLRECFAFPLSTAQARRDVVTGALLLATFLVGWILNLGHRLEVVRRVFHDEPPYFRGFTPWGKTFARGLGAFCAIACYLSPAAFLAVGAFLARGAIGIVLGVVAAVVFVVAIYALPGGMTYNAAYGDLSYLYRPDKALRRAIEGGSDYVRAWGIAIAAMVLSTLGLLAFGVGFFFTSVWAWSVVGYAFSRALVMKASAGAEGRRARRPYRTSVR